MPKIIKGSEKYQNGKNSFQYNFKWNSFILNTFSFDFECILLLERKAFAEDFTLCIVSCDLWISFFYMPINVFWFMRNFYFPRSFLWAICMKRLFHIKFPEIVEILRLNKMNKSIMPYYIIPRTPVLIGLICTILYELNLNQCMAD